MNEDSSQLSVEEWTYLALPFENNSGGELTLTPNPLGQGWRILKVSVFAGANAVQFRSPFTLGNLINIAANGCLELQPKAYNRPFDTISWSGDGSLVIVEFIYKNIPAGTNPNITAAP